MNRSDLLKQLRYGRVVKYIVHTSLDAAGKGGGYGWLSSEITPNEKCEYWFHVKTIKLKYPNIQEALDSDSHQVKKFSFPFWYTIKIQGERTFVDNVWLDWRELPINSEELVAELISRLQQCQESDKLEFARRLYEIALDLLSQYPTVEAEVLGHLDAETLFYTLEALTQISETALEVLHLKLQELATKTLISLGTRARKSQPLILNLLECRLNEATNEEDKNLIVTFLLDAVPDRYITNQRIRLSVKQHFSPDKYVTLIDRIVASRSADSDIVRTLLSEIEEFLLRVTGEQLERLWNFMPTLRSMVEVEGRLWNVAPISVKRDLLKADIERYFREPRTLLIARQYLPHEEYLALLDQVMNHPSAEQSLIAVLTAEVEGLSNELPVEILIRLYHKLQDSQAKAIVLRAVEQRLQNAGNRDASRIVRFLLEIDEDRCVKETWIRSAVRQCLPFEEYMALLDRAVSRSLNNQTLRQELIAEVERLLTGLSEERLEKLWGLIPTFKSMVEIEGCLWQVAPTTVKRERIMNLYPRFFRIVQEIRDNIKNQVVYRQQDITLDDDDIDLICTWANPYFARIREQYHRAEAKCKEIASRWGIDLEHLADFINQEYEQIKNELIIVREYQDAKDRYENLLPAYQQVLQLYGGDLNRFAAVRESVNTDYQIVIEYESAKSEYERVKQQLELLREQRTSYLGTEDIEEMALLLIYEAVYDRYEHITYDYEEVLWRWNYDLSELEHKKDILEQDYRTLEEYRLAEERYKELESSYLQVLAKWEGDIQKLHDRYQIVCADYASVREHKQYAGEYERQLRGHEACKQNLKSHETSKQNSKEHERECSARHAEKLALAFIRSILPSARIEDLSILQIKELYIEEFSILHLENLYDERWKLADIQISSREFSVLIDVKSARMSPNLMYYPELLVPRFKRDRGLTREKNVAICGVAMPAKTVRSDSQSEVELPVVLGFTTIDILTGLRDYYKANGIQFSLNRQDIEGNWLPVWVFDYNSRFYRGLLNLAAELRNLSDEEIPPAHYLSTYFPEVPAVAILIASKRHLPETFENSLKDWQKRLVCKLYSVYRFHTAITLPFIIAALISHFIEQVALEEEFEPSEYLDFLSVYGRPLGVVDPLHVVNNFVTYILKPLWEKRSDLSQYKIYQIHGMRLLRAKRNPSAPWETLVAWCQGCAFYPLVYGNHNHCERCKRLICDNKVPLDSDSEIFYVCSVCQLGNQGYSNECPECRVRLIEAKIDALEATIQSSEGQKQSERMNRVAVHLLRTLSEVQSLRSSPRMTKQISQLDELGIRILQYANFIIGKINQQSRRSTLQQALEQLIKEAEAVRQHAIATNRLEMIEDITARLKQLKQ